MHHAYKVKFASKCEKKPTLDVIKYTILPPHLNIFFPLSVANCILYYKHKVGNFIYRHDIIMH